MLFGSFGNLNDIYILQLLSQNFRLFSSSIFTAVSNSIKPHKQTRNFHTKAMSTPIRNRDVQPHDQELTCLVEYWIEVTNGGGGSHGVNEKDSVFGIIRLDANTPDYQSLYGKVLHLLNPPTTMFGFPLFVAALNARAQVRLGIQFELDAARKENSKVYLRISTQEEYEMAWSLMKGPIKFHIVAEAYQPTQLGYTTSETKLAC